MAQKEDDLVQLSFLTAVGLSCSECNFEKLVELFPAFKLEQTDIDFVSLRKHVFGVLANSGEPIKRQSGEYARMIELLGSPKRRSQVGPVIKQTDENVKNIMEMSKKAFLKNFLGNGPDLYFKYLCKILHDFNSDKSHYAIYHSMVNASMTGKSRLLQEMSRTRVFGFYMNFGDPSGFPRPTLRVKQWIASINSLAPCLQQYRIYCFILACLEHLLTWIDENRKSKMSPVDWFKKWIDYQSQPDFWDGVSDFSQSLEYEMLEAGAKECLKDRTFSTDILGKISKLLDSRSHRNLEIAVSELPRMKNWDVAIYRLYSARVLFQMHKLNDYLYAKGNGIFIGSELEKNNKILLAKWKVSKSPDCLFVFDEARYLLPEKGSFAFENFRRAARIGTNKANIVFVFTDTLSKSSDFSPPGELPDSYRAECDRGHKIFPPYWVMLTTDVYPECHRSFRPSLQDVRMDGAPESSVIVNDIVSAEGYACFGRAGLKACFEIDPEGIISLLTSKIRKSVEKITSKKAALSALGFLMALNVNPRSELATELVAHYMHRCTYVSNDRRYIYLLPVPEPLLGFTARSVIQNDKLWPLALKGINYNRDILDINVGDHGEAANQILRLMAHFAAESETLENAQIAELGACPILPVNVPDFLKKLGFCSDVFTKSEDKALFESLIHALRVCYSRIVQVTPSFGDPSPQHLADRFVRSNGILCRDRFIGVDTFFPMIVIRDDERILETEVSTEKMSFIAFQDKSYHDRPSYNSWCTKDMNLLRYTGGYYRDLNKELPYLCILMDCGASSKETNKPEYFIYKSQDEKQLCLAVRGLRPIHILGEDFVGIDAIQSEFERLLYGDTYPLGEADAELSSVIESTECSADLFSYTAEKQIEILETVGKSLLVAANDFITARTPGDPQGLIVSHAREGYEKAAKICFVNWESVKLGRMNQKANRVISTRVYGAHKWLLYLEGCLSDPTQSEDLFRKLFH